MITRFVPLSYLLLFFPRYPPPVSFECFNAVGEMTPEEAVILPRHVVMANLLAGNGLTGRGDGAANGANDDDEGVCTLCCDDRATVTLLPCGHDGFCRGCSAQMEMCPLCRTPIECRKDDDDGVADDDDDGDANDDERDSDDQNYEYDRGEKVDVGRALPSKTTNDARCISDDRLAVVAAEDEQINDVAEQISR